MSNIKLIEKLFECDSAKFSTEKVLRRAKKFLTLYLEDNYSANQQRRPFTHKLSHFTLNETNNNHPSITSQH